jgi:hypothetical protein
LVAICDDNDDNGDDGNGNDIAYSAVRVNTNAKKPEARAVRKSGY